MITNSPLGVSMSESTWGYAAGSAPQYGPSASPRSYRYAPIPTPDLQPWRAAAVCSTVDGDLWYPEKGGSTKEAKRICNTLCSVRLECLQFALDHDERFGVYGGLSERERRALQRKQEAA